MKWGVSNLLHPQMISSKPRKNRLNCEPFSQLGKVKAAGTDLESFECSKWISSGIFPAICLNRKTNPLRHQASGKRGYSHTALEVVSLAIESGWSKLVTRTRLEGKTTQKGAPTCSIGNHHYSGVPQLVGWIAPNWFGSLNPSSFSIPMSMGKVASKPPNYQIGER